VSLLGTNTLSRQQVISWSKAVSSQRTSKIAKHTEKHVRTQRKAVVVVATWGMADNFGDRITLKCRQSKNRQKSEFSFQVVFFFLYLWISAKTGRESVCFVIAGTTRSKTDR
jgi:hypothetical protein